MEQGLEDDLRSLIASTSSVDRERTRLTRETLLSLVKSAADQKKAVAFLADFTRSHDALEAAILKGSSKSEVASKRAACIALLDKIATPH